MRRPVPLLFFIAWLGGCALSPGSSHRPVQHLDFGPASYPADSCQIDARLGAIRPSQAIAGTEIWYRYADRPFAPAPYAFSRWSAPPTELLRRQLQAGFSGAADSARIDLELFRLELLVATQAESSTPKDARLQIELSAARYRPDGSLLERRFFVLEQDAEASPDGAAAAASRAIAAWQSELCRWLASRDAVP